MLFQTGMSLHKLMCPVWQFLILLLFAQGHYINATVKSLQKVPIMHSNTYAFFNWLHIGKVLIHGERM